MAYYPKSQIKTNLYTNGNEYVYDGTQQEYIGYYYAISNGNKFTGKTPNIVPTYLLAPITPTEIGLDNAPDGSLTAQIPPSVIEINPSSTYVPGNAKTRTIPQFSLTLPTEQDKQNGYFTRYFCKKNNELKYFETSQTTCDKLTSQDPSIAYDLYSGASIVWAIKGDITQVISINVSRVNKVSSQNNWLGFSQYFKDYSQYYVGV
jgi:hypothetical protein